MADEQIIRPGQIWRRKKSGKLFRIISQRSSPFGPSDDWFWRGQDYKGSGNSYGDYIRRDSELVSDPTTGDAPAAPPEVARARKALADLDREYQSGLGMNNAALAARASLKELLALVEKGPKA